MPGGKIDLRDWQRSRGSYADPERIEELEDRVAKHERATRGKPVRAFKDLLDEKLNRDRNKNRDQAEEEGTEDEDQQGAIDPHLGLGPTQKPTLATSRAAGRRSGKVIIKG